MKTKKRYRAKKNDLPLGEIRFVRCPDGTEEVIQGWNPYILTRLDRIEIADVLREIAEKIEDDLFEQDGVYEKVAPAITK